MYKIKLTTKIINSDGKVTYSATNYDSGYVCISNAYKRLNKINADFKDESFENEDDDIDYFGKIIINTPSVCERIKNKEIDEDLLVCCIRNNNTGITLKKSYTIEN